MKLFFTFISEGIPHLTPHHIVFWVELEQFPSGLSAFKYFNSNILMEHVNKVVNCIILVSVYDGTQHNTNNNANFARKWLLYISGY